MPKLYYVRYARGDATFLCERCVVYAVRPADVIVPPPAGRGLALVEPVYDSDLLYYRCTCCGADCTHFNN